MALSKTGESRQFGPDEACLQMNCRGFDATTAREIVAHLEKGIEPDPETAFQGKLQKIKGQFSTHTQYHFHMETQICVCVPNEDGMEGESEVHFA